MATKNAIFFSFSFFFLSSTFLKEGALGSKNLFRESFMRCGVAGGERVSLAPLVCYLFLNKFTNTTLSVFPEVYMRVPGSPCVSEPGIIFAIPGPASHLFYLVSININD